MVVVYVSRSVNSVLSVSKLEIIFCSYLAENNFVNALIPIIGVKAGEYF
jgi:hypothetical protein